MWEYLGRNLNGWCKYFSLIKFASAVTQRSFGSLQSEWHGLRDWNIFLLKTPVVDENNIDVSNKRGSTSAKEIISGICIQLRRRTHSHNLWLLLVIKDYLKVLKLFPVACRYGWHGWKWIETWKNWPFFFPILILCVPKILKKFSMVIPLWQNSFDIFVVTLQKHFVYD